MPDRDKERLTAISDLPQGVEPGYVTADDFVRDVTRPTGLHPAPSGTGAPDGTSGGNTGNVASNPPPVGSSHLEPASAEMGATATHHEQGIDAGSSLD